ncbi:Putative major facilitator superfamily, MFS transporter superfamily [Septoria linicola]|uniref:Major facilitator superfamily, MFS transporter superfamily n=1 Tax=Septoria linicola TaxID=215465 RepID=A0A9Q9EPM4_9PEZI|nr:putative major facilitator superfamily, MFS transporter superfamily [Septoria linicola]USW58245.1 Putative major facilitator superfamily, MFS transporter superfamily [Septoria linicola]
MSTTHASEDLNKTLASKDSSATQHEEQISEVSVRSVLALAGSALAYFCTVGFMNAYGVFQQYYTAHYLPTYSNFQISWIGSVATFVLFACAPAAGLLADKYGPSLPILIGSILEIIAIFMVSLCRRYYQFFLAQAVLLGVGMSFIAIATSTIVPLYFKRNRALAQGISIGGSSLGGILWPIALDQMLNKDDVSFGWTMRIIGFVMIPLLVMVLIFVRKPAVPTSTTVDTVENASEPEKKNAEETTPKKTIPSTLKQPPFILLCLGLAIAYLGFFAPIFYISVYATSLGFSEGFAFYLISILNGASLFGRILPGFIADRYGHFNILVLASVSSGLVVFCWTTATSIPGLVIWTIAYGFTSGAILSLQLACATGLTSEKERGKAIGVAMGSVSLTGLFGTPVAGELVERGDGSLAGFAGAMLVGGGLLLGCARLGKSRELWARV